MHYKIIAYSLSFVIFFAVTQALAQPVGNLIEPMGLKGPGIARMDRNQYGYMEVNFNEDIIFKKELSGTDPASNIDIDLEGKWHMASFSYAITKNIQPYIALGAAELDAEWTEAGQEIKLSSDRGLAFGAGLKLSLWKFGNTGITLASSSGYRMADLDIENIKVLNGTYLNPSNGLFQLKEWFSALTLSKRCDILGWGNIVFVPYAGVKYSDTNGRLRAQAGTATLNPGFEDNKYKIGGVAGCDMQLLGSLSLNAEARFIDENALSFGLTALF